MKFIDNSADIPDELISKTLEGNIVFLCGAGVSMSLAKFPSFKRLTLEIYKNLGETCRNDPAERLAFKRCEYDRTLRALEKRLHNPLDNKSRVREACSRLLEIKNKVDLSAHNSVLKISRNKNGKYRILTTNFDTLFERAASESGENVCSEAGKNLPKPGGIRDFGIHHLHGRIEDKKLNIPASDLILTSADFGDAYLRDGWASRYIEDRLRTATIILLGYGAEDVAPRLLLECLDVDRERFIDLNKIYAFDVAYLNSAALWKAKGITPIEFSSYSDIYNNLKVFADYAEKPTYFENRSIRRILSKLTSDLSDIDHSQIEYFLKKRGLNKKILDYNPSLTWLPEFIKLDILQFDDKLLADWITLNISDYKAASQIVSNINNFGSDVANILDEKIIEYKKELPKYLYLSWLIIIKSMKYVKITNDTYSDLFNIEECIKRGVINTDIISRLTDIITPKLRIFKPFSFDIDHNKPFVPNSILDIMSIKYETDGDFEIIDILDLWPKNNTVKFDRDYLESLYYSLNSILNEAFELSLEPKDGSGISERDVPSVAEHHQNQNHRGFLPIVRIIAETLALISKKDNFLAEKYIKDWIHSDHKLFHRLSMFACKHKEIHQSVAGKVILDLPQGELFLTGGTVEVYQLLLKRWSEFDEDVKNKIEARLRMGPPSDWFRDDCDINRHIDRCRFDLIGGLIRDGLEFSDETKRLYMEIKSRRPEWELRAADEAGFYYWQNDLEVTSPLGSYDPPDKILQDIEGQISSGVWDDTLWQALLWQQSPFVSADAPIRVSKLLLGCPPEFFSKVVQAASYWLTTKEVISSNRELWDVWDRIFASEMCSDIHYEENINDLPNASLNSPIGRLTRFLVKNLPKEESCHTFNYDIRPRLEKLLHGSDTHALFARVMMASDIITLYNRAPKWTTKNIIPQFNWSSEFAVHSWSARRYSPYIGTPEFFELTKTPFLELFGRTDIPEEVIHTYAEWLTTILISNKKSTRCYKLSLSEARSALRQSNPSMLRTVGHRLAKEMEAAKKEEKRTCWEDVVGPVFKGMWPLDNDMQTGVATYKLLQILKACGDAFPEAVDSILPFIRPEDKKQGISIYSLLDADDIIFNSSPSKMLKLVLAAVGNPPKEQVLGLGKVLERIRDADPDLADTHEYQTLLKAAGMD